MKKIARVKDAEPVGGDMEIKALSYRLVCHLLRNYRTEGLSGEKVLAEKNKASRVGEIVKYIAHNCHERITTASLASLFHLDEHYLCRLFKSQMGVPRCNMSTATASKRRKRFLKTPIEASPISLLPSALTTPPISPASSKSTRG